jgi:antitoxin ParD1/3/4
MTVKIVLDPESEAIARRQVEAGLYDSVDEAVRAGLRLLEEQVPYEGPDEIIRLKAAIEAGLASGPGRPAAEVFDRLEEKYRAMAENRTK